MVRGLHFNLTFPRAPVACRKEKEEEAQGDATIFNKLVINVPI
jgi:archaeosine-15-forming tRNA-guanine transglycosylase